VPLYDSRFGRKPGREKSQDFIAGGNRCLARSVDEMLSDDAMRVGYVLGKEWRDVRVRSAVRRLARDEAVSECRRVCRKALCSARLDGLHAIGMRVCPQKA